MKTVLIGISQGFVARYILRTDIFDTLVKSGRVQIVILVPNHDEPYFREEFDFENVKIHKLEREECEQYYTENRLRNFIFRVRKNVLNTDERIPFIDDKYQKWASENIEEHARSILIRNQSIKLMRKSRSLRKALMTFETSFWKGHFHRDIFEKYKPDLTITFSNGYFITDAILLREAKYHKSKTMGIILSWDNPTSKGYGGAEPDLFVTWTEKMKEELVQYHDVLPDKIIVGGIAHFDVYYNKSFETRESFCDRYGLDPEKKILLLATKSPTPYPNADIVHILVEAIANGKFCFPCQLLVRLHPNYFTSWKKNDLEEMNIIERRCSFVHVLRPKVLSRKLLCDMPKSDMEQLADILYHSDVMINMFSTMVIEAAVCDTPIVNVGFNGLYDHPRGGHRDIKIDRNQIHNKRIEKTGGVLIAENQEELFECIDKYLRDHSLKREGRQKIVENEAGPYKGTAGKFIGNRILAHIGAN